MQRHNWSKHSAMRDFPHIGPALLGVYFPVLPSWGSSQNSPEGAPLKSSPMNCQSTRIDQIWTRIFLCAISYEGSFNVNIFEWGDFIGSPSRKTLGLSAHWVIHRQSQAGSSVGMHLGNANGLTILSPLRTITVYFTYLYNLISSTLLNSSESLPY